MKYPVLPSASNVSHCTPYHLKVNCAVYTAALNNLLALLPRARPTYQAYCHDSHLSATDNGRQAGRHWWRHKKHDHSDAVPSDTMCGGNYGWIRMNRLPLTGFSWWRPRDSGRWVGWTRLQAHSVLSPLTISLVTQNEISGSHSSECEDDSLLRRCTVWSRVNLHETARRNIREGYIQPRVHLFGTTWDISAISCRFRWWSSGFDVMCVVL
jgi:hypothetical protein